MNSLKLTDPIFLNNFLNTEEGTAISQLNRKCLTWSCFAFCLAAFMPGPRDMRPASGVGFYKYPTSYDKVVSTVGLLFNSLIPKNLSITLAPFHNFDMLSIQAPAQFNGKKFVKFQKT